MLSFEAADKAKRLKIGLHGLNSGESEVEALAARYNVAADVVRECKREAKPLHERMARMHGHRYFENWNLAQSPEAIFPAFSLGPSLEEYEEAQRRKREGR